MANPPSGLVTFLFTDVEGSTRLWETHTSAMEHMLARHDELVRAAIEERGGYVFKTIGDAFCAAFTGPRPALEAAIAIQRALDAETWGEIDAIRVRAALHTGQAQERDDDYFGPAVNRVARLLSAGHGGQVLLSQAAINELGNATGDGVTLRDLGDRRLKDLTLPERIYQAVAPGLTDVFPALNSLDARPNNLPVQPTPLLGRETELEAIRAQFRTRGVHLLTLTGPGGAGKTRLALQAAADLIDDFPHGVWFVDLSAVTDPALVTAEIAGVLDVREEGQQSLEALLCDHLRERNLLLVLDNFEQVLPAATMVGGLIGASPGLRVLITSRRPVRIAAEHELPVPPLPAPDPARLPDPAHLTSFPAVELFVARAKAVQPAFALTGANAAAVAGICSELDGLPLAIELAAARVRLLPPAALLARLESRLALLTGGARDRPERQQTLRAAIAWSHDLLTPDEQTLFARLAVFTDGGTFAAIEDVAGGEAERWGGGKLLAVSRLPVFPSLFDNLAALVEHSLVRQDVTRTEHEPRFRMLATIREFAAEQLEASGEAGDVRRAHAAYFRQYAQDALAEPDETVWLDRVDTEHGNLRAALGWLNQTDGEEEAALRLAGSLSGFWFVRGHLSEGRTWLDQALARGQDAPAAVRAKALDGAGALAEAQGDFDRAETLFEQALALYRSVDDRRGVAIALDGLGALASKQGDYARAHGLHEEALALHRESGERLGIASSINNLGSLACLQGEPARAITLFEQVLDMCGDLGDRWFTALVHGNLAAASRDFGDHERSVNLYLESLALCKELGDKHGIADCLAGLGSVAIGSEDPARAARMFGAAQEVGKADGNAFIPADREQYERAVAMARSALGDDAFATEWAKGAALSLDDAIALSTAFSHSAARPSG